MLVNNKSQHVKRFKPRVQKRNMFECTLFDSLVLFAYAGHADHTCCAAQVQQAGGIITATCSAAFAAFVAVFVVQCSQDSAACGLLYDNSLGVPMYAPLCDCLVMC